MSDLRQNFEKLPDVADALNKHIVFIGNKYTTPEGGLFDLVNWLNGAWYTYQKQAAKIDALKAELEREKQRTINNYDACDDIVKMSDDIVKGLEAENDELHKKVEGQKSFIEMSLISLNHLKENAATHRDYGHESGWNNHFNDLIKLATDSEDTLKEALRGADLSSSEIPNSSFSVDWSQAPQWANYWTMDRDGESHWRKDKPLLCSDFWGGSADFAPSFNYVSNWQDSLRERPKNDI